MDGLGRAGIQQQATHGMDGLESQRRARRCSCAVWQPCLAEESACLHGGVVTSLLSTLHVLTYHLPSAVVYHLSHPSDSF